MMRVPFGTTTSMPSMTAPTCPGGSAMAGGGSALGSMGGGGAVLTVPEAMGVVVIGGLPRG